MISASSVTALTIDTVNDQFYIFGDDTTAKPIIGLNWTGNETYIVPYNETLYYVNDTGIWLNLANVSGGGGGGNPFNQDLNTTDDVNFNTVTAGNLAVTNWNTAYGWGDHSIQNYLDLDTYPNTDTDGTNDILDSDFVSSGLMKTDGAGGYSVITDGSTNWNTAYGWGDHSIQNYFDLDSDVLEDISDIDVTGRIDGSILEWDTGGSDWIIGTDDTGGGNPFDQDLNTTDSAIFEHLLLDDSSGTPLINITVPDSGIGKLWFNDEDSGDFFEFFFDERSNRFEAGCSMLSSSYSIFTIAQGTGFVGFGDNAPAYKVELLNVATTSGRGRANQWATYSDERFKDIWMQVPENKAIKVLENLTMYLFYWKEHEVVNGNWVIGETNTSAKGIGIMAQETYDFLSTNFNPEWAEVIVHPPENENIDEWSVDYDSLYTLMLVGTQYLIEQVKRIDNFLTYKFGGEYENFV